MFLKKLFGTSSQRKIKKLLPLVDQINELCESLQSKSDQDLIDRTTQLKQFVEDTISQTKSKLDKDADSSVIKKTIIEPAPNFRNVEFRYRR